MNANANTHDPPSTNTHADYPTITHFGTPEGRSQLAAADIIVAFDSFQETHWVLHGREILKQFVGSGVSRDALGIKINIDSVTDELDQLDALVREVTPAHS